MKLARYIGGGQIAIVEEDPPKCPDGGLLVRTEASGLCSGELMDWYMERKIPHVLGHEVAGIVVESYDDKFPVGARVAPHHHASCLACDFCLRGDYVHCEQWKRTKLVPGGMSELFAVGRENLTDTHIVAYCDQAAGDDSQLAVPALRAVDAALMEPLACVKKSLRRGNILGSSDRPAAVIGLGVMGLLHALGLKDGGVDVIAYDLNPARIKWARDLGIDAREPHDSRKADAVFVCPGTETAVQFAFELSAPDALLVLFSPLGPPGTLTLPLDELYFRDVSLVTSYSCGPDDTREALRDLREGKVVAEQVVSHFISLEELPKAYQAMKLGEILKPMVVFG